jgi:hypothetical protein
MAAIKDIETCFNYCAREAGYFSSNEQKWITKILRLKEQYPDLVTILKTPEENDGTIYAKMPVSFLKLRGPVRVSEATRKTNLENLTAAWAKKGLKTAPKAQDDNLPV